MEEMEELTSDLMPSLVATPALTFPDSQTHNLKDPTCILMAGK